MSDLDVKETERLREEAHWHMNQLEDQAHNDDPEGVKQHAADACARIMQLADTYIAWIRSGK